MALLAYSRAENNEINRGEVSILTLGTIASSNQDKLTATPETIRADKLDMVSNLNAAKNGIETVFKHLTTIDASSPNIDELKSRIDAKRKEGYKSIQQEIDDLEHERIRVFHKMMARDES